MGAAKDGNIRHRVLAKIYTKHWSTLCEIFTKNESLFFVKTGTLTYNWSVRAQQDYELVRAAIKGNQTAYTALMNRHQRSINLQMLKMVQNPTLADDLTLEAFAKAFRSLNNYIPRATFNTWLSRIAINNCIDFQRKKRIDYCSIDVPTADGDSDNFYHILPAANRNPEEEIIRTEKLAWTRHWLSQLDQRYQQALHLRFFEDYSYDEIAQELNIPIGTVKALLFRGKKELHKRMVKPTRLGCI